MRVWKHYIHEPDPLRPQQVTLLGHVHIVGFGVQGNRFVFWSEEDPDSSQGHMVEVQVFGTGWPIPADMTHAGTIQHASYAWHLYYRPVGTVTL